MVRDSLVESIRRRALDEPDSLALTLLADDGSEHALTIRDLDGAAGSIARALGVAGVSRREVVLIALRHSPELVAGFWGALYAGAVPSIVPFSVPMPDGATFARHVRELVIEAEARAVLAGARDAAILEDALRGSGCAVIAAQGSDRASRIGSVDAGGDDDAYLQYTSGTSGGRKGVILSHRAVLRFVEAFAGCRRFGDGDVVVSWLPLFHDYGLFAGMVMPVVTGIPTVLLSPFKFIRNPRAFLRAIQSHRGTISWMPNFAFEHCVRALRDSDLEGLDLGSLHTLNSGGEPVRLSTQERFLKRFAPVGLREGALSAGYGMAEVTLCATISPPFQRARAEWVDRSILETRRRAERRPDGSEGSVALVSCGLPLPGTSIAILDDQGRPLPERGVGEIAVASPSLFRGYRRRPDLTAKALRGDRFLTGDLGYVAEGELFVCGRKNDLIIVAGRNVQPEDVEALANEVDGVAAERAVAFGVWDETFGSERLVVVCDVERSVDGERRRAIERELRSRIRQELDLVPGDVQLFRRGWVVRTRNGKLARAATREKYLEWRRSI